MAEKEENFITLTQFSPGSLGELLSLLLPILLMSFSVSILGFVERIFLSRYSLQTLEASLSVIYLARIFQISMVSITNMAQVFVGQYNGAQEHSKIGSCIWQMIWFSFLSMIVTVPASILCARFFLKGTEIELLGYPYFYLLTGINFLYPLNGALTSFFLGQGKTKFILGTTIVTCLLNLGLDYVLIFGIPPYIPTLGILGVGISALMSQGILCIALLVVFLKKSNKEKYGTGQWAFNLSKFWRYIKPGILRAIGRVLLLTTWTATSFIMTKKGGDYLLVLSIGGTLSLFLTFIGDSICQAMVTILSNLIGARQLQFIQKALQSSFLLLLMIAAISAIPLVIFPKSVLLLFMKNELIGKYSQQTLTWIWLQNVAYILNSILLGVILARKDTSFLLLIACFNWVLCFVPVYLGIRWMNLSPDKFWLIIAMGFFVSSGLYLLRIWRQNWLDLNSLEKAQEIMNEKAG